MSEIHPQYAAYEELIAPARAKPEIWRVVAGMIAANFLPMFLFLMIVNMIGGTMGQAMADGVIAAFQTTPNTPGGTLVVLASFFFVFLGLALVLKFLHQRNLATVLGPAADALRDFKTVMKVLIVLSVILMFLPGPELATLPNLATRQWVVLLPASIVLLLVQVSAEEFLFRGYMQQQLAARFKSPLIWLTVPSILFGIEHYNPADAGQNAIPIVLVTIAFGVAAADLTARTGNLGAAIALHFTNNFSALLVATFAGPTSGLSLYLYDGTLDSPDLSPFLMVEAGLILVTWLAARLALKV